MGRRNLTIQLDEATIRRAKAIAAEQGVSIGGLVTQQIEQIVAETDRYNAAREQILRHLKKPPFRLGGARPGREELHANPSKRHRELGEYAGRIWIADDFDAPLNPETFTPQK